MIKFKEILKESDLGLTYKKGKTVVVVHKTSGKEIVIVDKPAVRKEYEKIGFFAEGVITEAGIDKSYKAIMDLEKHIQKLEQTFKREKSGMTRDRAKKMEKSIYNLKQCWNRLYTDTQAR